MMDAYWSAFNSASDPNQGRDRANLAQLQQASTVATIAGHVADQQAQTEARKRQQAARDAIAGLPAGATSEQVLTALRPHLNPEQLAPLLQSDVTHKAQLENTKALKMLDIGQRRAKLDQDYQLAISKAADGQQKAAVDQWYKANSLALRQEAVAQGADQNAYNLGMARPPVNLSPMPNAATPITAGPTIEGSAPDQVSAVAAINAGGGKPMSLEIPSAGTPPMAPSAAQPPAPDAWSSPVAAAPVASPAAPDAANLDANDMRARAAAAFQAAKAPIVSDGAPVVAPTAQTPASPVMPKFSGSPKEVAHQENLWRQGQAKLSGGVIPLEHANLHGPEYLATLPQASQNVVNGLISYKLPLNQLSARTGERSAAFAQAAQADPNFDVMKYPVRQKVVQDFTSGPIANNITALDQALNHMGTLSKLSDAIKNGDIPLANSIGNSWAKQTGKPEPGNYQVAQQAVATELMRVFRQVNASEQETKAWEASFPMNGSPAQIKGALAQGAKLLEGRVNAINNRWNNGMDVTTGYPKLMSPQAKSALDTLTAQGSTPATGFSDSDKERRYQEWKARQAQ